MFWSSNYTTNRELKNLLLEKNVTLIQVLEADDILQECKADYQTLSQFLSRPDILSELITLITEEPPKNVELSIQYRHANIACEVLTSNLSLLRDRLSSNSVQMNRLCDFVNKEPPLNPLLASYFSRTIEMLLEQSPKTDWYLHHIVCLRVLDFFKSRRDFVPNLLRHISTSAICDTFRCFLQTINNTNIILEWLDEYHFLDCLIQIICGTHDPEDVAQNLSFPNTKEIATNEINDKLDTNHNSEFEEKIDGLAVTAEKEVETNGSREESGGGGEESSREEWVARKERARRTRAVAASNAAALLCDIALDCALYNGYVYGNPWHAGKELAQRLRSEETVRRVLQGCFTSPAGARGAAVVHACRLLLALLKRAPPADPAPGAEAAAADETAEEKHREVERAVAPHLPLLHRALLRGADDDQGAEASTEGGAEGGAGRAAGAGAARVHVAALVARMALSDVDDVPTALISLGTAGVLLDLSLSCSHNNFLHAQLVAFVRNARSNQRFQERYTTHLIEECNLLTRLMDAFEENERGNCSVRAGYMGHVVLLLGELYDEPPELPPGQLLQRWTAFCDQRLKPLLQLHRALLGGRYPQENLQELKLTYEDMTKWQRPYDGAGFLKTIAPAGEVDEVDEVVDEVDEVDVLDDCDAPEDDEDYALNEEAMRVLSQTSPWKTEDANQGELTAGALEAAGAAGGSGVEGGAGAEGGADDTGGGAEEGWAHFDTPIDKYPFWAPSHDQESPSLSGALQNLRVSDDDKDALTILLAHRMLAFHNMAPEEGHHFETQEEQLETGAHTDQHGQRNRTLDGEDQYTHEGQNHIAHREEQQSPQGDKNQSDQNEKKGQNLNIQNIKIKDEKNQSAKEDQNLSAYDSHNQNENDQKHNAHEASNAFDSPSADPES